MTAAAVAETSLELTIGNLVPLTGDLSAFGPPGRKAADLAVKQIQAAAKEAGAEHTVEMVHADDRSDPQAGVRGGAETGRRREREMPRGPLGLTATIPVARSVAISGEDPADHAGRARGRPHRREGQRPAEPDLSADRFQGPALATVMEDALGGAQGKTINIGARNDPYGTGLSDTFSKAWEGKGGRVGERVIYEPDQPSYNTEAGRSPVVTPTRT